MLATPPKYSQAMQKFTTLALLCLCLGLGSVQSSQANIQIDFLESAPKDRFTIINIGECDLSDMDIEIDLTNSFGKLYFDTSAKGAGVEVFQPFESLSENLKASGTVGDGDTSVSIQVHRLLQDESISFTIDVDDALVNSSLGQIRVARGELAGAQARVKANSAEEVIAAFDANNVAIVLLPACA